MAKARSMAEREFVLSCDKELPENEKTVFLIKPLGGLFQSKLDDMTDQVEGAEIELEDEKRKLKMPMTKNPVSRKEYMMLRESLVGWRNFKTEDGHEIKFESLKPDERVDLLYLDWRVELCSFIYSLNYMDEAASKN